MTSVTKFKRTPLATKVYSPVEWEKRRKRQKRAAVRRRKSKSEEQ